MQGQFGAMQGMNGGGQLGLHNPGAIRRGGGRFNNRSGPYDRRGGGRGMGGGPGMRTGGMSYLAQGGGGGGGKWGDGAGGGMTMGPREAVQGRSIKSYEDLDAQPATNGGGDRLAASGTGGGAELDY